jgi:hypothetical protein
VKSTKLGLEQSNLWNLNIEVESLKLQEEEIISKVNEIIKRYGMM